MAPVDRSQPAWVATLLSSVEGVRDDLQDVKDDLRDVRSEVREVRTDVGGKEGLRERLTAMEVTVNNLVETVADLAGKETTPVSIVTSRKSTIKDHGVTVGISGVVMALVEVASQYLKTK